jgi:hypothetical protein
MDKEMTLEEQDQTMAWLNEAQAAFNVVDEELKKWEDAVGDTHGMVAARQRMAESWFWLQGVIVTRDAGVELLEPLD